MAFFFFFFFFFFFNRTLFFARGFPGGSEGKASACNVGDPSLIPGLGRSPGEGNGNPLQYPCQENPMDGCKGSDTAERLYFHFHFHGYSASIVAKKAM